MSLPEGYCNGFMNMKVFVCRNCEDGEICAIINGNFYVNGKFYVKNCLECKSFSPDFLKPLPKKEDKR